MLVEYVICERCGAEEEAIDDCVAPRDWWKINYQNICPKCITAKEKYKDLTAYRKELAITVRKQLRSSS